ncbi:MAG TPA: FAD/NAD(P)-binding protein, partial [Ignavibacteriaceae bacterium]|nr:FAD/NAD(P)-binding protein [Ignavibacteriaceae bacterium]
MNIYKPELVEIVDIVQETPDIKSFKLKFKDENVRNNFSFRAGQFAEYSVFGEGECTFCIASPPTRQEYLECSFKIAGKVTNALRKLNVGDTVGLRGPYGNHFPLDEMKGKNIVFIAGGIGLAPVRCIIWNVLDLRDQFKNITIIYGARTVADLVYKHELEEWKSMSSICTILTVDPGGEAPGWKGEIGFVPA